MPTDVLTFGETMLCVQSAGPLQLGDRPRVSIAGAESNVAVGLARLGHRVAWAGRVGADEPGRLVLRALRGEGVDVSHTASDPVAPTGLMVREHRVADLVRVQYWRSGSAASRTTARDLLPALDAGARVLHLTGITCALGAGPLAAVCAAADHGRSHGWTVVLDVNHRTRLWSAEDAARALSTLLLSVDVLIASDDELPLAAGSPGGDGHGAGESETEQINAVLGAGIREVVVKRGARGAELHTGSGEQYRVPARPVPAVDTVGAGDAFCAGYLSGILDGLGPQERLERATAVAAFCVATPGDWEGLPRRDELRLLDAAPGTALR